MFKYCLDCEWGEWSTTGSCSRDCGGGVRRVTRPIISGGDGCSLEDRSLESWRLEPCSDHPCPSSIAAWILICLVLVILLVVLVAAVFVYRRKVAQGGIPLRTFPTDNMF